MTKTFQKYSSEAVNRVAELKAEASDLAFVFLMAEFIDTVGSNKMKEMIPALEVKFRAMMAEYRAGRV